MKNIKKAIKQLIEYDRTLSILYIVMVFMVLGMLMVRIIAANMSSEIEKKHRKKVRLKCVYSNKKRK